MTMRYLVTCNGPTGRLLDEEWVEGEDAAEEMVICLRAEWGRRVCITYHSEQQIEDGE